MGNRGKPAKILPEVELQKLYVEERQTIRKIAKVFNVSSFTVNRYLHKYDIPVRSCHERTKSKPNVEKIKSEKTVKPLKQVNKKQSKEEKKLDYISSETAALEIIHVIGW